MLETEIAEVAEKFYWKWWLRLLGVGALVAAFVLGAKENIAAMWPGAIVGIALIGLSELDRLRKFRFSMEGVELVVEHAKRVTIEMERALDALQDIAKINAYATLNSVLANPDPFAAKQEQVEAFLAKLPALGVTDTEVKRLRERWISWMKSLYCNAFARVSLDENKATNIILQIWNPWWEAIRKTDPVDPSIVQAFESGLEGRGQTSGPKMKARLHDYEELWKQSKLVNPQDLDNRENWKWRE